MPLRTRLIIAAIAAALILIAYCWWRSPSVQAPRLWARIADAIAHGDAARTMDQLHPDYDVATQWPSAFATADDLGFGFGGDAKKTGTRRLALAGLQSLYASCAGNPLRLSWTIDDLRSDDDGVVALVSLSLGAANASPSPVTMPRLTRHRFVLARDGALSAALYIRSHDRIEVDF